MSRWLLVVLFVVAVPLDVSAQQQFPATLAGHAYLPAQAISLAPPGDAPESFAISGKYTGPDWRRVDAIGTIPGRSYISDRSAPRPTGVSTPFKGQPLQGFSGIKATQDGSFWVTTDNGFGAQKDSADALLMFHHIKPDWNAGTVQHLRTVFLHDPDRKIPFLVVNESTKERYLTGADLDIESMQLVGDSVWFGDEFGPYLVRTDLNGKVLALHETKLDGKSLRSPDHYAVNTPAVPGGFSTPVRRSRGFEGRRRRRMASSSTRCSKGRSGSRRRRSGKPIRTAASTFVFWNLTLRRATGANAPGNTGLKRPATTSATST